LSYRGANTVKIEQIHCFSKKNWGGGGGCISNPNQHLGPPLPTPATRPQASAAGRLLHDTALHLLWRVISARGRGRHRRSLPIGRMYRRLSSPPHPGCSVIAVGLLCLAPPPRSSSPCAVPHQGQGWQRAHEAGGAAGEATIFWLRLPPNRFRERVFW
jgi:hypothetical protein